MTKEITLDFDPSDSWIYGTTFEDSPRPTLEPGDKLMLPVIIKELKFFEATDGFPDDYAFWSIALEPDGKKSPEDDGLIRVTLEMGEKEKQCIEVLENYETFADKYMATRDLIDFLQTRVSEESET